MTTENKIRERIKIIEDDLKKTKKILKIEETPKIKDISFIETLNDAILIKTAQISELKWVLM